MAASYRAIRLSPRPTDATPSEFVDDAAENEVIVDGASHIVNNSISDDTASFENMEVQVPIVKKQLLLMDNEHINGIKEVFKDVEYADYLIDEDIGRSKSVDACNASLIRCSKFLMFSFHLMKGLNLVPQPAAVMPWIAHFADDSKSISFFVKYLLVRMVKSASRSVFMADIRDLVTWFAYHRSPTNFPQYKISPEAVDMVMTVTRQVGNNARNQIKRNHRLQSATAHDDRVKRRKWPKSGLPELQIAVINRMAWVRTINMDTPIDEVIYYAVVSLLICAIYLFFPQGRLSGVMDMRIDQVPVLLGSLPGFALTRVFKTSFTYGLQAVGLGAMAKEILTIFINFVRPSASRNTVSGVPGAKDFVFANYSGVQDALLGRRFTSFLSRYTHLHITTATVLCVLYYYVYAHV